MQAMQMSLLHGSSNSSTGHVCCRACRLRFASRQSGRLPSVPGRQQSSKSRKRLTLQQQQRQTAGLAAAGSIQQ
jgi:hypothetical protein